MAVRLSGEVGIIQTSKFDDTDLFCFKAMMVDKDLRQNYSAILSINGLGFQL